MTPNRRQFLSSAAAIGLVAPHVLTQTASAKAGPTSKNERLGIGTIGMRYQGSVIAHKAQDYGDIVAIADVDRNVLHQARASFGSTPRIFENYQDLLARKDVDVVTIGTPDHWHVKIAVDACRAGKDVYVEKPLSLTIDEGKILREVAKETGRIIQVGSWQRSDHRFRLAVELVRQGRLGDLERVDIVLGKTPTGGPFEVTKPPKSINWDLWQGQTPEVPYIEERCHFTFRWWQAYSGGEMTDWGAHHIDIGQWGIGAAPIAVHGKAKYPNIKNGYDQPIDFHAEYTFPGGVLMTVSDEGRNGILFTGSKGRIFVNRGTVDGKPVEDLANDPLPREQFTVYENDNLSRPERAGKLDAIINHMGNFFDCVRSRKQPISDVESQHRSVSTCHLGNISMLLDRPLQWDPQKEQFVGDDEANKLLKREQRKGFEIA